MGDEEALLIEVLREQPGGFDPAQASGEVYKRLSVDSQQGLLAMFDAAMSNDWVVIIEREGRTVFLPSPLLEELPETPEKTVGKSEAGADDAPANAVPTDG